MAKYQVVKGQLLRHKDSSVRAYPGDVVNSSDSCIAQQADIDRVCITVASATAVSATPAGDDATSDATPSGIGGPV